MKDLESKLIRIVESQMMEVLVGQGVKVKVSPRDLDSVRECFQGIKIEGRYLT